MPVITNAGEYLITQQQQAGQPLIIDQMILANIAGLDENTIPSRDQVMPAPGDVKITKPITKDGLLNSNTVVYSTVFPSTDGTFDFNWMGLYSSAHDTIVAVAYVPLQTKIKTVGTDIGNVITKNFAIEFNAAADITGINISAESWQIDYTARLMSMDKHQRDLVKNIYGPSTFLNDAFKVKHVTDKYYLTAGKAILGGINFELEADLEIVPGALPQTVWLDVYQETSMMGVLNKHDIVINDGTVLADYVVGSVEHTLVKLGVVNSAVDIVDGRSLVKRSLELTTKNNDPKNVAELRKYRPEYAGQKFDIDGHTLPGIGGGPFYHDPDDSTSPDNNGTVIVNEWGERWKRSLNGFVTPEMCGARLGVDATASIAAAYATGESVCWAPIPYIVSASNQFIYKAGQNTHGNNARILVSDGATITDTAGDGFGRFNNHILSANTTEAFGVVTVIKDLHVECEAEKINGFGGNHTLVRSNNTGIINIFRCTVNGKGTASGLGGHLPAPSYTVLGAFSYFSNMSVRFKDNVGSDIGQGIMATSGLYVEVQNNKMNFCGVSRDFTSWQNQSAVNVHAEVLIIRGNRLCVTGGSAMFARRTLGTEVNAGVKEIYVEDNTGIGCGLSFCGAGTRSFSDESHIDFISYKRNKVYGWLCAIGAQVHTACSISLEDSNASTIGTVATGGNEIDYLAPWETFNEATNEVDGSYNADKKAGQDHGNQYGILISSGANGSITKQVSTSFDAVLNHDTLGISISGVPNISAMFKAVNVGWQRDGAGDAFQIQQSVRINNCAGTAIIDIERHGQSVNRDNSFTTPVLIQDFDGGVSMRTIRSGDSVKEGQAIRLVQTTADTQLTVLDLNSDCKNNDAGNLYYIDSSAGAFTKVNPIVWDAKTLTNRVEGSRGLDVSVGAICQKVGSFAPISPTLPPASVMVDRTIEVFGINNTMTIQPNGTDLINGANSSVQVLAGETAVISCDGIEWIFSLR